MSFFNMSSSVSITKKNYINVKNQVACSSYGLHLNERLHDATKACGHATKSHYVNGFIATCDCRKKDG